MAQNNYIRRLLANKTALQVASSQRPTDDEIIASTSTYNINKYKDYELYIQFNSPAVPEPSRPLEKIKEIDVPAKNGTDPLSRKHIDKMDPEPDSDDACPAFCSLQDLTPDEMASSFVQFLICVLSFVL